jgi:hypothetical protein
MNGSHLTSTPIVGVRAPIHRALRVPYRGDVVVQVRQARIMGQGTNLSTSGMLFDVPREVPLQPYLRVKLDLGLNRWVDVSARQVREIVVADHRLWGVRSLQLAPQHAHALQSFVIASHLRQSATDGSHRSTSRLRSERTVDSMGIDELDDEIRKLIREAARSVDAPPREMPPPRSRPLR